MFTRLAFITLSFLWGSSVQAQIGVSSPPVLRPASVTCTDMAARKQVPCPDSELFFHEGQAPVQSALNARNFAELDALYDRWCVGKDRFPDGRWKLSQYEAALSGNFNAWGAWAKDLEVITAWQKSAPRSAAARFAEAVYWHAYAWKARGEGYASSVSKEGWELFRERLAKADAAMAKFPKMMECAAPHALRLNLLTGQGATEAQFLKAYEEAASKFPEYHSIHFAMAQHYEPKWGGSAAQYEAFADRVAARTKGFEGMGMYARLYWIVDTRQGQPFTNSPTQPPSWRKLKAGYQDLMRLYPSSMHNLGKFAGVACRSREGELYRKLRTAIAGHQETADMLDPVDVCDRRHGWVESKG